MAEHDWQNAGFASGEGGVTCSRCGQWCMPNSTVHGSSCRGTKLILSDEPVKQVGGNHYKMGDVEPFKVIDKWSETWPKETVFYLANTLKCLSRLGRKSKTYGDILEDVRKALHYLEEAEHRLADFCEDNGSETHQF